MRARSRSAGRSSIARGIRARAGTSRSGAAQRGGGRQRRRSRPAASLRSGRTNVGTAAWSCSTPATALTSSSRSATWRDRRRHRSSGDRTNARVLAALAAEPSARGSSATPRRRSTWRRRQRPRSGVSRAPCECSEWIPASLRVPRRHGVRSRGAVDAIASVVSCEQDVLARRRRGCRIRRELRARCAREASRLPRPS